MPAGKKNQTLKYKTSREIFPTYISFALVKTVIFRRTVNRIWKKLRHYSRLPKYLVPFYEMHIDSK